MTTTEPKTLTVEPRVILTELKDGTGLLLHLGTKVYFTLNETGVFVWKALAERAQSRGALVDRLMGQFEVEREQAARDLDAMLRELTDEELVHER